MLTPGAQFLTLKRLVDPSPGAHAHVCRELNLGGPTASGEGSAALIKAKKAEKYLRKPSLTNLLAAQAAEIAGESEHAEEIYKDAS